MISFSQISTEEEKKIRMNNKISERQEYEFNLNTNDSILKDIDFYDNQGKHIKDNRFNENGEIRYQYIIEYNSDGLMNKQTGYKFGEISTILTYNYDENGNRTENFQHSPDGKLLTHQKRIYENKLNTELYNKNVKFNTFFLSYKYYYDNNGLLKKTERFKANGKKFQLRNMLMIKRITLFSFMKIKREKEIFT
ncbi:hypothetical protein C8N41_1115 [Winogradskyella sediminis]|nr:hypothetical protein C8N41_1115 [Winogradskyella sediminis]